MKQDDFLNRLQQKYAKNVQISRVKNADYADVDDAFKNFKTCEAYGVDPKQGILVRMSDKMTRVSNLLTRKNAVVDESINDTLADLANYAMILSLYIEDENEQREKTIATSGGAGGTGSFTG